MRLLGAGLILAASVLLAAALSRSETVRVRQYEGMLRLLRAIREEIACFRTPTAAIYARFENDALAAAGFLPVLRERGFSAALTAAGERLLFDAEDARTLSAFAAGLGQHYPAEEIALCDRTIAELSASYDRKRREAPGRARAARSLVLCGGAMLVLLFL